MYLWGGEGAVLGTRMLGAQLRKVWGQRVRVEGVCECECECERGQRVRVEGNERGNQWQSMAMREAIKDSAYV